MRVNTNNVQLIFKCKNEKCIVDERFESDPVEMCNSGVPICPECGDDLNIDPECFIKN